MYITPRPTPAPGENSPPLPTAYNYLPIPKCLEPVPTLNWSFNWFTVETSSGKVNSSSNPPQVAFLPDGILYEDYQTECAVWEELKQLLLNKNVINSIYVISEDGKKKLLSFPKNFPISELISSQPDLSKYKGLLVGKQGEGILLKINESTQLKLNYVLHTNDLEPIADPSIAEWISLDDTIVSVTKSGLITAHKAGYATIKVTIGNIGYNFGVSVNN